MAINQPPRPSEIDDIKNTARRNLLGTRKNPDFDIDAYKTKFLGSNARAYLFVCNVAFPGIQNMLAGGMMEALSNPGEIQKMVDAGIIAAGETALTIGGSSIGTKDFKYFVKASSLPEINIEETSTYWAGQQYKMAGVRRTNDWTVTFLINNDAGVVRKFWDWHLIMHNPENNIYGKPKDYMVDQSVQLLGLDGVPICTYKLYSAWPKSISQVDLDYTNNEFATVDITFAYQYLTVTEKEEAGAAQGARKAVRSLGASML